MKHKSGINLPFLLLWGSFLIFYICVIHNGEKEIISNIDSSMKLAEDIDFYERFTEGGIFSPHHEDKKVIQFTWTDEEGTHSQYFEDSISEELVIRLVAQYELTSYNPLQPDEFDSLFHEKLSSHIHVQQTGIIYRFKDKVQYSKNDSTSFLRNAFMSEERVLDVQKVVRVQGWAKVGLVGIVLASSTPMLITTACLLLFAIAFTLYLILKKAKGVPLEEEGWTIYSGLKYQLAQNKLFIEGEEIAIRPAELKLLHLFVMHPKHELSKEDIAHEFWPKEDAPENKIYNHISTLKGIFKGFTNYAIKRKGNLYQLKVPNYNKRGYQRLWSAIGDRLKALRAI